MAAEDRWLYKGDLPRELEDKLSECLWWVLVLADRLGVDITKAFTAKMNELDVQLTKSVARSKKRPKSATANSRRALRLRVAGDLAVAPALHRRSPAAVAGRSVSETSRQNI